MTDVQTSTSTEAQHQELARPNTVPTRRAVLAGAGALGTTCLLAACGTDAGSDTAVPKPPAGTAAAPAAGATTGNPTTEGGSSGGEALALVADVPKGGGIIKGDYVITQPSEGNFKAFSKICTHQGCPVTEVDAGAINCKCHKSAFSIEDGSVQGGPAKKALAETKVKVEGDSIVAA